MPGPKMGPRPPDFNEELIQQAPTFKKWQTLPNGENLRYACRDFIKGHGGEEERLMRRIMIARRNNLKDHEVLKRARVERDIIGDGGGGDDNAGEVSGGIRSPEAQSGQGHDDSEAAPGRGEVVIKIEDNPVEHVSGGAAVDAGAMTETALGDRPEGPAIKAPATPPNPKKRRLKGTLLMSDEEVLQEMDLPAVEATRSYKRWIALSIGREFTYNQTYIKGRDGHDWLLKKNIWRRMRYRRENKKMVDDLIPAATRVVVRATPIGIRSGRSFESSPPTLAKSAGDGVDSDAAEMLSNAAVEAAVAAAESYVREGVIENEAVAAALGAASGATIGNTLSGDMKSAAIVEKAAAGSAVGMDAVSSALDAAAKLAASVVPTLDEDHVAATVPETIEV